MQYTEYTPSAITDSWRWIVSADCTCHLSRHDHCQMVLWTADRPLLLFIVFTRQSACRGQIFKVQS